MMLLSTAILKGAKLAPADGAKLYFQQWGPDHLDQIPTPASDILGAALLGSMSARWVESFLDHAKMSSDETLCANVMHELHRAFPHLGCSIRVRSFQYPSGSIRFTKEFVEDLEREAVVPKLRGGSARGPLANTSLWTVLTRLYDRGWTKTQIAELLGKHGL